MAYHPHQFSLTNLELLKMLDLVSQLVAVESTLKNLATEWVIVLDNDGTVLFNAQGDAVSVGLPKEEAAKFIGKTLTHYHPVVTSFSESDIAIAACYQLREIRAVDDKYLYRMCSPTEGWDEFQWQMLDGWQFHGVFKAVCVRCKHKHRTVRPVCDAFPTGIPKEIWMGENDHSTPYPGDRGIRFEPVIEPAKAEAL